MKRIGIMMLSLLLMITGTAGVAYAWSNGGYSENISEPKYGTHDMILENAISMLPLDMQDKINNTVASYGSELPDCTEGTYCIGDSLKHHVYYYSSGELQDDIGAVRAQAEYDLAKTYLENGDKYNFSLHIGAMSHYISDLASFGHTMGADTDWGAELNHSNYEDYVDNHLDEFNNVVFDSQFENISAYNGTLKTANETTFDAEIYTNVWMENNYNWSDPNYVRRTDDMINYSTNIVADVVYNIINDTKKDVPLIAPTIIDWSNDNTNDKSQSLTIYENDTVKFGVTPDQDINSWLWALNGNDLSNNNDNLTYTFNNNGSYTLEVNGSNANGTTQKIIWNIVVLQSQESQNNLDSSLITSWSPDIVGYIIVDGATSQTIDYSITTLEPMTTNSWEVDGGTVTGNGAPNTYHYTHTWDDKSIGAHTITFKGSNADHRVEFRWYIFVINSEYRRGEILNIINDMFSDQNKNVEVIVAERMLISKEKIDRERSIYGLVPMMYESSMIKGEKERKKENTDKESINIGSHRYSKENINIIKESLKNRKHGIIKESLKNRKHGIIKGEEENSKIFDNIKDLNKENLNINNKEDIEKIISDMLHQK